MTQASADSLCDQIYEQYVQYDNTKMEENKALSRALVESFKDYLTDDCKVKVEVQEQGSSFEGIKVGEPNEFDFLLVLDCGDKVQPSAVYNVSGKGFDRTKLAGHWELRTKNQDHDLAQYTVNGALSINKYKRKFQKFIAKWVAILDTVPHLQGRIKSAPSIGKTALTVQMTDSYGTEMSVDMSICIKVLVDVWSNEPIRYYIAKQDDTEGSDTFWLVVNSRKELAMFRGMSDEVKKSYRIVKFLLYGGKHVKSSYVVKTSFLHLYQTHRDKVLNSALNLLAKMIAFLKEKYGEGKLTVYHNQRENLFEGCSELYLKERSNFFAHRDKKPIADVLQYLMKKAVAQVVYKRPMCEVESWTEGDVYHSSRNAFEEESEERLVADEVEMIRTAAKRKDKAKARAAMDKRLEEDSSEDEGGRETIPIVPACDHHTYLATGSASSQSGTAQASRSREGVDYDDHYRHDDEDDEDDNEDDDDVDFNVDDRYDDTWWLNENGVARNQTARRPTNTVTQEEVEQFVNAVAQTAEQVQENCLVM